MITHQRLLQILHYDPETGVFTRIGTRKGPDTKDGQAGHINARGYRVIYCDGRPYKAHRLAIFYQTGRWPAADTDHRNRQKGENRFENLRESTRSENVLNAAPRCDNTTGVKGVSRCGDAFMVRLSVRGKRIYLGIFETIEAAAIARIQAVKSHHPSIASDLNS